MIICLFMEMSFECVMIMDMQTVSAMCYGYTDSV